MIKTLSVWLTASWYRKSALTWLLWPLSQLFEITVRLRKQFYGAGILPTTRLSVPVIVVGNISVGGTGKTPLIIWLAEFLVASGFRPGIVSRGYGGQARVWPQWVHGHSDARLVGDEAVLIASRTGCPMAVAPKRVDAAKLLLASNACNIILSDDGLQHYAMARDIEIAVIDGERRFGNGLCLPAGPLREPVSRLCFVDAIVVNGVSTDADEFSMRMSGDWVINLATAEQKHLHEFSGAACHAVAGIGNPERFFDQLERAGLCCQRHPFPDHHPFAQEDIEFADHDPVLMTDKDAVKCNIFADRRHWRVPINAVPETGFSERILNLLREHHARHQVT